ncbi:GbsR/MarR family transcriptional regulator [Gordonia sp. SL306]|uniref:GbsR/MarR family transcriptional regulator n=1 Tax=Gordonia sp. SL306 TaxID=2995145 RepID=UPI002271B7C5|nr:MarR family transcriptional regulator [Gordonia sp. SL306]WAC53907.1 MarR family transcriptional regulator [Gordonia sp. SL306]
MPDDAQLTFADHMARYYARRFSFPPMVGRVIGYLSVCDPPGQSIAELSEALLASRSAITGAIENLENLGVVKRTRTAGERMDRIAIDLSTPRSLGFDMTEYEELADLAREGLEVIGDATAERRAALSETAALADFLIDRIPALYEEWKKHRAALVMSGDLYDPNADGTPDEDGDRK